MKISYRQALPTCQGDPRCTDPAEYDIPTMMGPWGNFCERHKAIVGSSYADTLGSKLVVGERPTLTRAEQHRDLMAAIEAGDFDAAEDIVGDGDIAEWL